MINLVLHQATIVVAARHDPELAKRTDLPLAPFLGDEFDVTSHEDVDGIRKVRGSLL